MTLDSKSQPTTGINQGFYPRTGPPGREIHPAAAVFPDSGWSSKRKLAMGLLAAALVAVLILFYVVYDVGSYYGDEGFKAAGLSGPARKPSVLARDVISEGQKLKVVEKLPEPVKEVKKEPPPPPPVETPTPEPMGNFAVQVAVVYSEQLAQPMVDKLKEAGYHAYFYRTEHKGKALYKVRVGYFETDAQAKEIENKLKSQGHKDAFISHVKE